MKKTLYFLLCLLSLTNFSFSNELTSTRSLKSISYETQETLTFAFIELSDNSFWQTPCTFFDEKLLNSWKENDTIRISTDDKHPGIKLTNVNNSTCIYTIPTPQSLDLYPTIIHIDIIPGFFSNTYRLHLSDNTCWELLNAFSELSYRWKVGQKVLLSKELFEIVVNLDLTFAIGYRDDRSICVSFSKEKPYVEKEIEPEEEEEEEEPFKWRY